MGHVLCKILDQSGTSREDQLVLTLLSVWEILDVNKEWVALQNALTLCTYPFIRLESERWICWSSALLQCISHSPLTLDKTSKPPECVRPSKLARVYTETPSLRQTSTSIHRNTTVETSVFQTTKEVRHAENQSLRRQTCPGIPHDEFCKV